MPCDPTELKHVPLFALLDDDEVAVLAAQVDLAIVVVATTSSEGSDRVRILVVNRELFIA